MIGHCKRRHAAFNRVRRSSRKVGSKLFTGGKTEAQVKPHRFISTETSSKAGERLSVRLLVTAFVRFDYDLRFIRLRWRIFSAADVENSCSQKKAESVTSEFEITRELFFFLFCSEMTTG